MERCCCPVPLTSAAQNPPVRRPDAKPNTQSQYSAVSESENVNFAHDRKIRQIAVLKKCNQVQCILWSKKDVFINNDHISFSPLWKEQTTYQDIMHQNKQITRVRPCGPHYPLALSINHRRYGATVKFKREIVTFYFCYLIVQLYIWFYWDFIRGA